VPWCRPRVIQYRSQISLSFYILFPHHYHWSLNSTSIAMGGPELPPASVPVIDISPLFTSDVATKRDVALQIGSACRDPGFFYASNHGVSVDELSKVTKRFHTQISPDEKKQLAIRAYNPGSKHIRNGYSLPITGKKAVESWCFLNPNFTPDHAEIQAGTPMHEVNDWPDEATHPGFQDFQTRYYWSVFHVSLTVLRGMAIALGKPEDFFNDKFRKTDTLSSVALIRYPFLDPYPAEAIKTAQDGTKLSFEWHEDVSLITVLFQSQVQNLQVLTKLGYQDVPANDDCFLINCGSFMDYITKGYFFAPKHRVKWVNEERQSIPFFVNLGQNTRIAPFTPNNEEKDEPLDGPPMSYGEYLNNGLKALVVKNGQT
jgi:isopenicillin-N synthase